MKKYLIKGLLALVAGGFAASCADKDVDYVPLAQQKSQAYEKAFEEMIGGKVDPNQDWGFESIALPEEDAATRAMTRTINVNGNLWNDCPEVGTKEETDVLAYLSTLQTKEKNPVRLQNYFVTQIHKGDETYNNKDGGYVGKGSDKMNNLHIAMSDGLTISNKGILSAEGPTAWDHINNFNAGTCNDWGAGDADGQGNTMVLNGGTFDFAYQGADDSKYHNRWCSIDGANVPRTDGKGANYAGYYYICFDFEQNVDAKTAVYFRDENGDPHNAYVIGSYSNVTEATGATCIVDIYGPVNGSWGKTGEKRYVFGQSEGCTEWRVDNVINGNMIVDPNSSYKDWIIRLVKATPAGSSPDDPGTGTTPPPSETTTTTTQHIKKKVLVVQGRVFCEDLGTVGRKDIDFNDIVFDARIWYTFEFDRVTTGSNTVNQNYSAGKYEAEICLLAAGGTIPVKLAERNVHDIFQPAAGLTTMVNTVDDHADTDNWITWENSSAERDPVTFTYDMTTIVNQKGTISLNDIPLEVLWTMGSSDDPSSGYGTMQSVGVLNANLGQVPHKICLPIGTVWPSERRSMDEAYKYFGMWATNKNSYPEFYKNEGDQVTTAYLYTGKTTGLSLTDANGREYYTTNDGNIWTNYSAEEIRSSSSYSVIETTLWEGSQTYAPEASNNNLTIASVTFNVGDKFRVYGTNGSGSERWITFHDSNWGAIISAGPDFSAKGYHSIVVETQDQANKLSNGPLLNIAGKDMTITKITKVSTSSN